MQNRNLTETLAREQAMIPVVDDETLALALARKVDAKDHYTNGHSLRVARYAGLIAARLGMSEDQQKKIYNMGLLHDVGKIGISGTIINKPSRLTEQEFEEIRTHTTIGYEILNTIMEEPDLAVGARWHHERYDGCGYPDGLSGTDIPEEARIICMADCYDAMTSRRSYTTIHPQAQVRAEILRCRGTQFDPEIANAMVAIMDDDHAYHLSELGQIHMAEETMEEIAGDDPITAAEYDDVLAALSDSAALMDYEQTARMLRALPLYRIAPDDREDFSAIRHAFHELDWEGLIFAIDAAKVHHE